jgi:hypothetical protein
VRGHHGRIICRSAIKNDSRAICVRERGQTIWIADADRDGKRFVVHADEKLTAFIELESAIRACGDCKPGPQTVLNNQ